MPPKFRAPQSDVERRGALSKGEIPTQLMRASCNGDRGCRVPQNRVDGIAVGNRWCIIGDSPRVSNSCVKDEADSVPVGRGRVLEFAARNSCERISFIHTFQLHYREQYQYFPI